MNLQVVTEVCKSENYGSAPTDAPARKIVRSKGVEGLKLPPGFGFCESNRIGHSALASSDASSVMLN